MTRKQPVIWAKIAKVDGKNKVHFMNPQVLRRDN